LPERLKQVGTWRAAADGSGAAICFLRDRLGPAGRCSGGCRRRGFFLVIFRFAATMEHELLAATGSTRFAGDADQSAQKPR
jgi:hypothetical protein